MTALVPVQRLDSARQLALFWGLFSLSVLVLAPFAELVTGVLPGCHFERLSGLPCPTCGAKTAAYHLAHADPLAALRASPLATLVWVGVLGGGLVIGGVTLLDRSGRFVRWLVKGAARFDPVAQRRTALVFLAVAVANWFYLLSIARA